MTVEISLTKGYTTIVNDEDADLAQVKWQADDCKKSNGVYAVRTVGGRKNRKGVRLHCLVIERIIGRSLQKGEEVDHIDLDGLNNRRENLRLATHQQNQRNKTKYKCNKSGYKGVFKLKTTKKDSWIAGISVNGKRIHLGSFNDPELAHDAYCEAAKKYGKDFARGS